MKAIKILFVLIIFSTQSLIAQIEPSQIRIVLVVKSNTLRVSIENISLQNIYLSKNSLKITMSRINKYNKNLENITKEWLQSEILNPSIDTNQTLGEKCYDVAGIKNTSFLQEYEEFFFKTVKTNDTVGIHDTLGEILRNCIFLKKGERYCETFSLSTLPISTKKRFLFVYKLVPDIYFKLNQYGFEVLNKRDKKKHKRLVELPLKLGDFYKLNHSSVNSIKF